MRSHTSGFVCGLTCLHAAGGACLSFVAIKQGHPRILHLSSPCAQLRMSWSHLSVLMHTELLIFSIFLLTTPCNIECYSILCVE